MHSITPANAQNPMPKCTSATFASFSRLTSTPNRKTSTMFHGSVRYIHLAT